MSKSEKQGSSARPRRNDPLQRENLRFAHRLIAGTLPIRLADSLKTLPKPRASLSAGLQPTSRPCISGCNRTPDRGSPATEGRSLLARHRGIRKMP